MTTQQKQRLAVKKMNRQDSESKECPYQNRSSRRARILEIFTQHRKKDCLLYAKPFENTKNINLFNNSDFFRCIKHMQSKHSDVFSTNSANFDISLKEIKEHIAVIRYLNDLFFVEIEVTRNVDKVYVTVTRLNSNIYSLRHDRYAIEFKNDNCVLAKYGRARLKRNLDDTPRTIETSINGLKSFFGENIKNIRMSITIELYVTCNKCHDIISHSEGKYFMKTGWYCVTCARNCVRTCGHVWQDCQFMDIEEKQKKHGLFFCFYRNICYICRGTVRTENGGPITHYRDKHQNVTHLTEVTFRLMTSDGDYMLLEHRGELFVCRYHLDDTEFHFAIRTPWQFEQIKEHRCYMTLSPAADITLVNKEPETRTYEMQKSLECFDDWQIDLKNFTFSGWCSRFDVSIKLERISQTNL